jgi:hypothetical protein
MTMTPSVSGNGYVLKWANGQTEGPERNLTTTEAGYAKGLRTAFGQTGFSFPHKCFEAVDIMGVKDYERFRGLPTNTDAFVERLNRLVEPHSSRFSGHVFQFTKEMAERRLPDNFVHGHVLAQAKSNLTCGTILDANRDGLVEAYAADVEELKGILDEAKKIPRVSLDFSCPSDDLTKQKAWAAYDAGIRLFDFQFRSLNEHFPKFTFMSELSSKGAWISMHDVPRFYTGDFQGKALPVSYPSLLTLFGVRGVTIRLYRGVGGDGIVYDKLRLFDEPSLGVLSRKEQQERYQDEELFVSDCFREFNELRRSDVYSYCGERLLHQPFYAYETVASRYSLQDSHDKLKANKANEYAEQHEFLGKAADWIQELQG